MLRTSSKEKEVKREKQNPDEMKPSSTAAKVRNMLRNLYMQLPVNGSFVSGWRYPHIPRLTGSVLGGKFSEATANDGLGLGEVINEAAALAEKDPRGMCYFWVGPQFFLVITRPQEVRSILVHNKNNVDRTGALKTFSAVFGDDNILSMPKGDAWHKKRGVFKEYLFDDEALKQVTPKLEKIIDHHMATLPNTSIDLDQFFVSLTMDIFSQARLGTASMVPHSLELSKVLEKGMLTSLNPSNHISLTLAAITKYFSYKTRVRPIEEARNALRSTVEKSVIKPNIETIQQSENLLRALAQLEQNTEEQKKQPHELKLNTPLMLADTSLALLAGHETTSRLLQFMVVLLSDHPNVLAKIYEEIEKNSPANGHWQKEDIEKLIYLKMTIKECLRLYPPAGVSGRAVTHSFTLGNISYVEYSEYAEKMRERNTAEDVTLYPGDIVILSPLAMHYSEKYFPNPDQFLPERFCPINPQYGKVDENGAYIPFNAGERSCIGKQFAILEASLILVKFLGKLKELKMTLEPYAVLEDQQKIPIHHPIPVHVHGTLKPNFPLFTRFKQKEAEVKTEEFPKHEIHCHPFRSQSA